MINLDLNTSQVAVIYSLKPVSPIKIGDVILLQKKHELELNYIKSKPPWKDLLVGDWEYKTGTLYKDDSSINNDHIIFYTKRERVDIERVSDIVNSDICNIVLLQEVHANAYNKVHVIKNCQLVGLKISKLDMVIDFRVAKCEIIHNN